jgi:hypothetical protein
MLFQNKVKPETIASILLPSVLFTSTDVTPSFRVTSIKRCQPDTETRKAGPISGHPADRSVYEIQTNKQTKAHLSLGRFPSVYVLGSLPTRKRTSYPPVILPIRSSPLPSMKALNMRFSTLSGAKRTMITRASR